MHRRFVSAPQNEKKRGEMRDRMSRRCLMKGVSAASENCSVRTSQWSSSFHYACGGEGARRPAHGAGILIAGYLEQTVRRLGGQSQLTGATAAPAYLGQLRRCDRPDQRERSSNLSRTRISLLAAQRVPSQRSNRGSSVACRRIPRHPESTSILLLPPRACTRSPISPWVKQMTLSFSKVE